MKTDKTRWCPLCGAQHTVQAGDAPPWEPNITCKQIEALPELLEIVKEVEREYDCMNRKLTSEVKMHARIKAVIAKATGNHQ